MTQKTPLPYGAWPSPLSTDLVLASAIALGDNYVGPKALVWTEQRPEQGGRNALVSRIDGKVQEVLPEEKWNARTRVHEYGGACAAVMGTSVVFSSVEGPLYKVDHAGGAWGTPAQVSPESSVNRYADLSPHPTNPSLILSILEDHTTDLPSAVLNSIVLLSLPTSTLYPVVSGTDFYSSPRWSAGGRICWIQWKHPDMPWEGSELWVAEVGLKDGEVDLENVFKAGSAKKVAGEGKGVESVSQPRWAEDEEKLLFLSDRTGFYELYEWTQEGGVRLVLEEPTGADAGGPDWVLGQSTNASLAPNKWISVASKGRLRVIDLVSRTSTLLDTPYQSIASLRTLSPTSLLVTGSPSASPAFLSILTLGEKDVSVEVLKSSSSASVDKDYISEGKAITYPTKPAAGESDDQVAYATFYEPANKRAVGLDGELPPLVVRCHGGPTSSAKSGLDWLVQFFTSRGFAFVDVNYGGSTGFGRQFRKRLDKNWGIVDVQDTIACVEYLVKEGKADAKRVAITGGSAGGFTVLAALCAGKVFGAGTSLYGVSDLALLAGDTHKFESQYLFNLLSFILPDQFRDANESLRAIFKVGPGSQANLLSRERISRAKKMMTPFVLRRKKAQVLKDLPKKSERVEWCDMTDLQREVYNEAITRSKKALLELPDDEVEELGDVVEDEDDEKPKPKKKGPRASSTKTGNKSDGNASSNVLMDLRKASNHPMLFRRLYTDKILKAMSRDCLKELEFTDRDQNLIYEDMEVMTDFELHRFAMGYKHLKKYCLQNDEWMSAGKINTLLRLLPELKANGDRVLLFSQFTQVLDILEVVLNTMGMKYLKLTGQTPVTERQGLVDEYSNDPDITVFLLSTRAGGLGLNLTTANTVIFYDQDYNPHNDKQAEDRSYRIGQVRDVTVIKLITKGSLEEDMRALATQKLLLDSSVSSSSQYPAVAGAAAPAAEDEGNSGAAEKKMRTSLLSNLKKRFEGETHGVPGSQGGVSQAVAQ